MARNVRCHLRQESPTSIEEQYLGNYTRNRPYSRRGHDGQKERLGLHIYRKCARQYVNCDVTSLLLHVPVTLAIAVT